MIIPPLANSDGVKTAAPMGIMQFAYCVYLLVCADDSQQAGLFKLGISSRLESRCREHIRNWNSFDLARSALVWVDSFEEARRLEISLLRHYSTPEADAKARATGQQLSSEEFIALGSNRRNPGQQKDGCTEFLTIECMEKVLKTAEHLMDCSGNTAKGSRVQRDLTLLFSTCGTLLPQQPKSRSERLALAHARQDQQEAAETAQAAAIAGVALELAQAYREHLLWVNLGLWRWHLANPAWSKFCSTQGWADLYFGRFGPPRPQPRMRMADEPPPTPAETGFVGLYNRLVAAALGETSESHRHSDQNHRLMDAVYSTDDSVGNSKRVVAKGSFPHPVCADALVLRVNFARCELVHPFFARFVALSQRAESQQRWEQSQLLGKTQTAERLEQSDFALQAT